MTLLDLFEKNADAFLLVLFVGLLFMGLGYFTKGKRSHDFRILGWVLFGLYWPTQTLKYVAENDPSNATFTAVAPLLTGYAAYHEWKSRKWNEDPAALRWITGAVFLAAATYFLVYEVPWVTDKLIQFTTWQSALMVEFAFGVPASYAQDASGNWNIYIHGQEYAVTVILACTAIQSMMIFVGAIACVDAPSKAKWKALAASVIPIYFLNLFRNASIVYGYKVLQWNPFAWGGPRPDGWRGWGWMELRDPYGSYVGLTQGSFEFIHSYVAKGIALLALVIIALIVFTILPQLHNAILDIFDLRKRHRPGFFDQPAMAVAGEDSGKRKPPTEAPAGSTKPGAGTDAAMGAK